MLRSGDAKFRQAYVRLLVDNIEVRGPEIRLSGSNSVLAAAVANSHKVRTEKVLSFVHEWHPIGYESVNPRRFTLLLAA